MEQDVEYYDDFGSKIGLIAHKIRHQFNRLFQDYDLTYPQSRVLTYLFRNQDHAYINQRELELRSVLDESAAEIESTLASGIGAEDLEIVDRALEKMIHNLGENA